MPSASSVREWESGPTTTVAGYVLACLLAGCASMHPLMPTPVLYTGPNARPVFTDAPNESRPPLDLLFVTDRARGAGPGDPPYTSERSRSIAFGSATIEFSKRETVELGKTTELGRFPAIPYELQETHDGMRRAPAVVAAHAQARERLQAEVASRLAEARRKEVVLFIHGYNESFETAASTMGELCHFLGRDFVCAVFTWPAGATGGRLFG